MLHPHKSQKLAELMIWQKLQVEVLLHSSCTAADSFLAAFNVHVAAQDRATPLDVVNTMRYINAAADSRHAGQLLVCISAFRPDTSTILGPMNQLLQAMQIQHQDIQDLRGDIQNLRGDVRRGFFIESSDSLKSKHLLTSKQARNSIAADTVNLEIVPFLNGDDPVMVVRMLFHHVGQY